MTVGGRWAAGITMLVLPLTAGILMWVMAADVLRPHLDGVAALTPGASGERGVDIPSEVLPLPNYRYVAATDGRGLSALDGDLFRERPRTELAVVEENGGVTVGLLLSYDDPVRGTDNADGDANLHALVHSSSDAVTEVRLSDVRIFLATQGAQTFFVWQQSNGFNVLIPDDDTAYRGYVKALKRNLLL